jgi:hypothetical protein
MTRPLAVPQALCQGMLDVLQVVAVLPSQPYFGGSDLCFCPISTPQSVLVFLTGEVILGQMDILVLAAAAIVGVAYGRMRVRPDGSPSAWFTINPWAEWYCVAQVLFSGGMAAALLLKREW